MQQAAVGHPLDCHPEIISEIQKNKNEEKVTSLNTEYFWNKRNFNLRKISRRSFHTFLF
jgi:hypothetical protein